MADPAVELPARRTSASKTFVRVQRGQPVPEYTTEIGSLVHFGPDMREYKPVLRPGTGGIYEIEDAPFALDVGSLGVEVRDRGNGRGFRLSGSAPPEVQPDGRRIHLPRGAGVTWGISVAKWGYKLELTVPNRIGTRSFSLPMTKIGGGEFAVGPDNSLISDEFAISAPILIGANGVIYPTSGWTIVGGTIRCTISDTALPGEAFPYVIDPAVTTFAVTGSGEDGSVVSAESATYPPSYLLTSLTGSNVGARRRDTTTGNYAIILGFIRWDTATLPDDAVVTAAEFRLYVNYINPTPDSGRQAVFEWYDFGAALDSGDYTTTAASTAHAGTDLTSLVDETVNIFAAQNLSSISKTAKTGIRMHVSGGQPTQYNQYQVSSFDHATHPEPALVVTYTSATEDAASADLTRTYVGSGS